MTLSNPHLNTVDSVLRRSARRTPLKPALIFHDQMWSYAELEDIVTRAAQYLLSLGLNPGDRVAAYGKNSDAYAISFLACARAGLVHVPINYALKNDELNYLLENSGSAVVLADSDLCENVLSLDKCSAKVIVMRGAEGSFIHASLECEAGDLDSPISDSDLVQLLYTSGTTSKPKGAMMTHRALLHEYSSCLVALDFTPEDAPLICMPIYHSAGMHCFLMPYLQIGATVSILESPDIPKVLEYIEFHRIGSVFLAPTVWVPLSNHPDLDLRDLSSLKKAQYGASAMPLAVLSRLRDRFPDLGFYNLFGQSEIGPLATVLSPSEHDGREGSCGRSVLFVDMKIVDEKGDEVPAGVAGEVVYQSPQLCEGYWQNPQATDEAFQGGWFHSGDLAIQDDGGYLTIVDRIKDVINTGGVLVASREVEDAIYTHSAVAEVAVVGIPDDRWIEAIAAFIVIKAGETQPTVDELIAHLKKRLAPFKVPKKFNFVTELPKNQSGKLLKRLLREVH
ncbi:MAG: fatty acyl-CoA synthetase [Mycobacteriaceae bacterium]